LSALGEIAMPIVIQCPSCDSRLKVSEEKRGKKLRCPKCEEVFKADPAVPETTKIRSGDPKRAFRSERDDDDDDAPRKSRRLSEDDSDNDRKARKDDWDDDDGDERPVRRKKNKKKKKKKQASARWPKIAGLAGGGVVALAFLFWVIVKITSGGPPAQPVTNWQKYVSSEEGEFGFEFPASWPAKSYGIKGVREAEITGPSASIIVKENLVGSVVADISGAGFGGGPISDDQLPVARVHEMRRPTDSRSYKENAAETVAARTGKIRRSEFVNGSRRGYRATVLLHQTALDVFCECRDSDWETLRPAFEHVIQTLGRGSP
jgi:predicted Zn finger-like uncharacterized protein